MTERAHPYQTGKTMNQQNYYDYQASIQDAISEAQTALNRIKECQSHLYHEQALEGILALIDATAKLRSIHHRRTN